MTEWDVTENDIQRTESVLLPRGCNLLMMQRQLFGVGSQKMFLLAPEVEKLPFYLQNLSSLRIKYH